MNIKSGYTEDSSEKVSRYINGLRLDIQDELIILSPSTVEESYQCALNVEEKLNRKKNSGKGKAPAYRGKEKEDGKGKFSTEKDEVDGSSQQEKSSREDDSRGKG